MKIAIQSGFELMKWLSNSVAPPAAVIPPDSGKACLFQGTSNWRPKFGSVHALSHL